ncbi:MAG TPA: very short patch repair endonuclease [Terriglobales bacterium]|nr:very short patch repair endonuclease [Terriglobales bacterium]
MLSQRTCVPPIIPIVDNVSRIERSKQMSLVRSKNTKPEMLVRRLVYGMGYRYRLHQADLPGRPDLVFRSRRKVVFVHGCFWHGHRCKLGRMPKSRLDYWSPKIRGNHQRDIRTRRRLHRMDWKVLVLWECQLRNCDHDALADKLQTFLEP